MKFETKSVGSLCRKITDGSHFSPKDEIDGKYPMYSVKDMEYNGFNDDNCKKIGDQIFNKLSKSDCRPLKDDILIAKDGSYLKYAFKIKETLNACILSSIAILRPQISEINPDYFVYLLRSKSVKDAMSNYVSGSALPRIILSDFKKMKVRIISEKAIQDKISSYLLKYDQLIENNTRRIALLEKMAQELYKEWFMRFRFPGHEHVKMVNGVPEGWSYLNLNRICEIKYGKENNDRSEGSIPIFGSGGIMCYGNRTLYSGETVLIPRKGSLNNIMYYNGDFWTVDTMFYSIIIIKHCAKYLYYSLAQYDMAGLNTGSALPSMTTDILSHLKILLPDANTLKTFDETVSIWYKQKEILSNLNKNLTKQRNLLLPRLMSGKLELP